MISLAHINKLRLGQPWLRCWITPKRGSTSVLVRLNAEPGPKLDPRGLFNNPFGRHVNYAAKFNRITICWFKAN